MSVFTRIADRFLGRGEAAVTVPVFDGVLKPNHRLDEAREWLRLDAPGDLVAEAGALWVADGNRVLEIDTNTPGAGREVLAVSGPITGLARIAGGFAVAIAGSAVEVFGGALDGQRWTGAEGREFVCVNALAAEGDTLIVTDGSAANAPDAWQHDLMEKRREGRVVRLGSGRAEVIASGLAHAFGAAVADGTIWVSESWAHRVVALGAGQPTPVLDHLPGYPSRLAPAADGGWWLSVFASRTQLVEFVLREDRFRREMMRTIPPELWVAPQLRPPESFREPLQGGAIKQMGVLKPWAPPRSYGLVIRLDETGRALSALHSRSGGRNHGVTAVAEAAGALWVLSHGAGALLRVEIGETP